MTQPASTSLVVDLCSTGSSTSLLAANTINIAAGIAAMGDALHLLIGGPACFYCMIFGLLCLVLQVFLRYERYVGYLKWLTLALLSYVAVVRGDDVRDHVLPAVGAP